MDAAWRTTAYTLAQARSWSSPAILNAYASDFSPELLCTGSGSLRLQEEDMSAL